MDQARDMAAEAQFEHVNLAGERKATPDMAEPAPLGRGPAPEDPVWTDGGWGMRQGL